MTRTLDYTLAIKTGHEIAPTPSACTVDLDDLLQNGSCTVEALKEHTKGSLGFQALYVAVRGPNLLKSDGSLGFSPYESRCADKMYFLNGSLYRHTGEDTDVQRLLDNKCDLNLLLSVTTLLGTPLSVTAAARSTAPSVAPQVAPQPAAASDRSFQVFIKTLTGKTLARAVYGSTTVEELKLMLHEAEGIHPDDQRLIKGCRHMEDKRDLACYSIGRESVIQLSSWLRGGMYHCTSGRLDNSELTKEPLTHTQVTVVVPGHGEVQLSVPIDNDFTGKKLVEQLQQHLAELEAAAAAAAAAGTTTAAATAMTTAHEEAGVMTAAGGGVEEGTGLSTGPAASSGVEQAEQQEADGLPAVNRQRLSGSSV